MKERGECVTTEGTTADGPADGRPRVVVGVDGSPNSLEAVEWAAAYALRSGAVLHLLAAWLPPTPLVPVRADGRDSYSATAAAHARRATEHATGTAPGVTVETEIVESLPGQALLEASRRAALVVVGRRGLCGLRGLLMGSVSQQCAEHAACPSVVVPGPVD